MSSPVRWRVIKTIFARSLPVSKRHKDVRKRDRERGVRQQRFWEYFLLHDKTFAAYVDSCLLQSGKHRYLAYVADWPHSTFQAGAAFTPKAGSHHWTCLVCQRLRRVNAFGGSRFALDPPYLYPGYALARPSTKLHVDGPSPAGTTCAMIDQRA
jgi:hypothetical protein